MAASCSLRAVLRLALTRFRCSADGRRFWATRFRTGQKSVVRRPPAGAAECVRTCWTCVSEAGRWTGAAGQGLLWTSVAFSLFSHSDDLEAETQKKHDEMILLLKKAKLSLHRGQLEEASGFLHQAVVLAHQTNNRQGIIYTYSLMANLAYIQGQLDNAEKLFKAAMSYMLSGGTPEDDNAIVEMSLKLATIYAEQNRAELAEHGFRFCTESLEAKLKKHQETPVEEQTGEDQDQDLDLDQDLDPGLDQDQDLDPGLDQEPVQGQDQGQDLVLVGLFGLLSWLLCPEELEALRKETRLLLGLCLDSRARYRASALHLKQAQQDYQEALNICRQEQGDAHPQTLVLMSDLATILDLQGRHGDALSLIQQAVDLSRSAGHPDQQVLLGNLAGVLLHAGRLDDSLRVYEEALSLAQRAGDQEALDRILEGLKEVKRRRNQQKEEEAAGH